MGNPKKANSRRSRAERRKAAKGVRVDNSPPDYIVARRALFAGIGHDRPGIYEMHNGTLVPIDSTSDPLGQLYLLGLLDNTGHPPEEMLRKGRFWGCHYARLLKASGVKMGAYERAAKGESSGSLTAADLLFDRMDANLPMFERNVLLSLVVDPLIGHEETVPWAQGLIGEALLERGRIPPMMVFPTMQDRELLAAAVRGLVILIDGALPQRWAQERSAA